jgi:hypothetical protein
MSPVETNLKKRKNFSVRGKNAANRIAEVSDQIAKSLFESELKAAK